MSSDIVLPAYIHTCNCENDTALSLHRYTILRSLVLKSVQCCHNLQVSMYALYEYCIRMCIHIHRYVHIIVHIITGC